ncbi:benzoate/H(+) symporter BenE family transporter [Actinospica sp. MGRD01-02]|uniref:Benzoate/H(+) symporter BenE family transporter n=1 Tax=Actinospica acidithermotolerans TaxID=2828514 RepID=A0A941EIB2_9ACTN|nr:benzoate/H(+) symporter BenE family transporter [Actinospica acidithermotolerans]MBR7831235.1 benzoate/H(+) symporter BenE family transporter [Actinospica acidithermotolerans]
MERSLYGTAPGSTQPPIAGLVTALVGFSASFALVDVGLRAVGADQRQAVSGLFASCLAVGGLAIWYGVRRRQPISIAWSTPGAALLVTAGRQHGGYAAAVGAFAVAGALLVLTGLSSRLVGWIGRIPAPITSALLAGVLLPLCLAPVRAAVQIPSLALGPIIVWLLLSRFARRWAAPAALAVVLVEVAVHHTGRVGGMGIGLLPRLSFTVPTLSVGALVGIALPLYVITMAAQNLPGQAVLRGFGYEAGLRGPLLGTGAATVLGAPFGVFAVCLAAISAALSAGPDAHPDPRRRWIASVSAGCVYIALGLSAALAMSLLAVAPPLLIEAVAGLALLTTFGGALAAAVGAPDHREAAAITFAVSASGISVLSIGAPFWGLVCGLAALLILSPRRKSASVRPAT